MSHLVGKPLQTIGSETDLQHFTVQPKDTSGTQPRKDGLSKSTSRGTVDSVISTPSSPITTQTTTSGGTLPRPKERRLSVGSHAGATYTYNNSPSTLRRVSQQSQTETVLRKNVSVMSTTATSLMNVNVSALSKEEVEDLTHRTFDAEYHLRTLGLFIVLVVVLIIQEAIVWHHSRQVTKYDPLSRVKLATTDLLRTYGTFTQIRATTNMTEPMALGNLKLATGHLIGNVTAFNNIVHNATRDGWEVFRIQIIPTALTYAELTVMGMLVFINQSLPWVRSRGMQYIWLLSVTAILLLTSLSLTSCSYLLVLFRFPILDIKNPATLDELKRVGKRVMDAGTVLSVSNFILCCCYCSSMVQRQRVIYLIFARSIKARRVNYMLPFPLAFVVGAIACITPFVWRYHYDYDPYKVAIGLSGLWLIVVVYASWLAYYIYLSRLATTEFSDFYLNIRQCVLIFLTICPYLIYLSLNPLALNVGWWALARFSITVGAGDQFLCQWVQKRYKYTLAGHQASHTTGTSVSHSQHMPKSTSTLAIDKVSAPNLAESTEISRV